MKSKLMNTWIYTEIPTGRTFSENFTPEAILTSGFILQNDLVNLKCNMKNLLSDKTSADQRDTLRPKLFYSDINLRRESRQNAMKMQRSL